MMKRKGSRTSTDKILDYATDARLSTATRNFLHALNTAGLPPLESLTPSAARAILQSAQSSIMVDYSGIAEEEKWIDTDGMHVKLNIVRPQGIDGILPVVIYIHGGGWVLGDYPTHRRMVRDLVVLSGCVAVFVNYSPTPEKTYPTQINEIYASIEWVTRHGDEIGVDGNNLAVVGNSVGGNMTAVICLMAKERQGPVIKLQILLWPIVDANFQTESYKQFGKDRYLTAASMKWMYDMYIPNPEDRKDIYASPLQATTEQLKGLPPALILVAENDILRDEGEAYGRKLDEAGVLATTIRYNGTIHDWGLLNGLAEAPETRALFIQVAAELRTALR